MTRSVDHRNTGYSARSDSLRRAWSSVRAYSYMVVVSVDGEGETT